MTELIAGHFPVETFVNADPECAPERKYLVQTFRMVRKDKGGWRKELQWSFYGESESIAMSKAKAFIASEIKAAAKRDVGKEARKEGFYSKSAKRARAALCGG